MSHKTSDEFFSLTHKLCQMGQIQWKEDSDGMPTVEKTFMKLQ